MIRAQICSANDVNCKNIAANGQNNINSLSLNGLLK